MWCISIGHCLGVAMGSLETCTHVIPMPESHTLILFLTHPNLVQILFPHVPLRNENVVISGLHNLKKKNDDKNVAISGMQKLST